MKFSVLAAAAILAILAQPASAETVSVTQQGAAGGVLTRDTACAGRLGVGGCATTWSYTNPAGARWTGERATATGRWRGAQRSAVTGPNGNTVQRGRAWRR